MDQLAVTSCCHSASNHSGFLLFYTKKIPSKEGLLISRDERFCLIFLKGYLFSIGKVNILVNYYHSTQLKITFNDFPWKIKPHPRKPKTVEGVPPFLSDGTPIFLY